VKRAALATAALLLGCAAPEAPGEAASPILGGAVDSGDPAVVMLVSIPADQSSFETCTATLVAPAVLLTAAHCVDPSTHAGFTFGVFTGPDASAYPTAASLAPQLAAVSATHVHPDYDAAAPFHADLGVALLAAPLAVTPVPMRRAALTADMVGKPARIVGYGQTSYGDLNEIKHEATTVLASIGADDTIVVGDAAERSCVGDSGGPALVDVGGVETVVGVDSFTDLKGCLEPANYRRPDKYTEFLDAFVPPPGADAGAGGSGGGSTGPAEAGGCSAAPGGSGAPGALVTALAMAALGVRRRRR
jgi:MYXO-CTERM domain-containing protein